MPTGLAGEEGSREGTRSMHSPPLAIIEASPVHRMVHSSRRLSVQEHHATKAYETYVRAQRNKTDALAADGQAADQWVGREQLEQIANHIRAHLTIKTRFAFCHGTRSGREAVWFRELLPDVQTWGTELSAIAAFSAPWTIQWDFHNAKSEWLGKLDFVYSNALDHSFNATLAITSWMSQVHQGGALYIHWSDQNNKPSSATDIFRGGKSKMVSTICKAGSFHVSMLKLPAYHAPPEAAAKRKAMGLPPSRANRGDHAYVVQHGGSGNDSSNSELAKEIVNMCTH